MFVNYCRAHPKNETESDLIFVRVMHREVSRNGGVDGGNLMLAAVVIVRRGGGFLFSSCSMCSFQWQFWAVLDFGAGGVIFLNSVVLGDRK